MRKGIPKFKNIEIFFTNNTIPSATTVRTPHLPATHSIALAVLINDINPDNVRVTFYLSWFYINGLVFEIGAFRFNWIQLT